MRMLESSGLWSLPLPLKILLYGGLLRFVLGVPGARQLDVHPSIAHCSLSCMAMRDKLVICDGVTQILQLSGSKKLHSKLSSHQRTKSGRMYGDYTPRSMQGGAVCLLSSVRLACTWCAAVHVQALLHSVSWLHTVAKRSQS